jgi:hypothetical protein
MFFVLATISMLIAQSGTTSLRGTVTDPTLATVSGATVTLSSPERGFSRSVTSGDAGQYEFLQLQPGKYQLTVEMTGFRKAEKKDIALLVDTPSTLNMRLEVGATTETIEVSGETPVINTTDASVGNAFNENQVKSLPMEGRNVPDLLSLQAGVAYTGNRPDINQAVDTRSGAVNGARSDQSNITLDGVDVNDNANGGEAFQAVLPITGDSVQEFRVTTSNYNADQGRSSGAQVSLVTKSGTNNFHGAVYEYHRNTITSANDYFVKQSEIASGESNRPQKLIRNIFGGAVGGPIIKNRLFFFANYEGGRQREEHSALRVVPTDALRDGVMMYQCDDPADPKCSGIPVQGQSGQSYPVPAGFAGLSTNDLIQMDPVTAVPKGPNPVMLAYLQGFPHPNDNSVGYGVNFQGFRFKGPYSYDHDWYIARVDYKLNASGTHTLYWRGGLRNDKKNDVPYLPGTPSIQSLVDYSKGFSLGYSAALSNTILNTFRWGFTRQSFGRIGNNDTQPFIFFRTLNNNEVGDQSDLSVMRSKSTQVPIHNFLDDVSWSRGKHVLQFGMNLGFVRQPQSSFVNSFSQGVTNASWLDTGGMAGQGADHMDPGANGFPAVSPDFAQGYDYPLATLLGMVAEVDAQYNFQRDGSALPDGAAVKRRFAQNYYEFYGQDTWKIRPNLTLTYGLRYSLFTPPWETNGLQVAPTISLSDWFNQRRVNMLQGIPSNQNPLLSFNLAGPANGKAGFYHFDKKDFAPRLAIAWSPEPKTTVRAGFGMVYDHLGQTLLTTFDNQGSFGMATNLSNVGGVQTVESAPRVTDLHTIPHTDYDGNNIFQPSPGGTFPTQFPADAFQVYWGMDDKLKTPYSYMLDFSVGHELPRGFALQATYVGRLAHRLLAQTDLAMPLDLVDPKSGLDYFKAIRPLSEAALSGVLSQNFDPSTIGAAAQYWANTIQPLVPGGAYILKRCTGGQVLSTTSAAQAVYDRNCPFVGGIGETTTIQALDQFGIQDANNPGIFYKGIGASAPNAGTQSAYTWLSPQFASLYAWRSNSNSSYHALQLNLRKNMSQGVQFDFNYTFSKSIDLASDAQRIQGTTGGLGGQVINSWDPNQHRGVSDFDTTHQINVNWIAELPFGRGKYVARDSGPLVDAIIGGWELSGIARWTSGFPVSVSNGNNYPTNWELSGFATVTGTPRTHKTKAADGSVNLFADPTGPDAIGAFRQDFPGESGQRNILRGDGYAELDLGLSKLWKVRESQGVRFQWQVFNVTNLTRFNVQALSLSLTNSSTFGNYTGLLTQPRVMQFALRYEF